MKPKQFYQEVDIKIDLLPANRELDVLVAKKVMGCTVKWRRPRRFKIKTGRPDYVYCACRGHPHADKDFGCDDMLACYSTDISSAWEVVEKIKMSIVLIWRESEHDWECTFGWKYTSYDPTAPLAICHAALKAVLNA